MYLPDIEKIYQGSTAVSKIYYGSTLVWPKNVTKKYKLTKLSTLNTTLVNRVVILEGSGQHDYILAKNGDYFDRWVKGTLNADGTLTLPDDAALFTSSGGTLYYGNTECHPWSENVWSTKYLSTKSGWAVAHPFGIASVDSGSEYCLTATDNQGRFYLKHDAHFKSLEESTSCTNIYYLTEV